MSIVKIALTGGIACGKSQVANLFDKYNLTLIDLDLINKEIIQTKEVILKLKKIIGNNIFKENKLDKKLLKQHIFYDLDKKRKLEDFLHPKIINLMQEKLAKSKKQVSIVVIPLLYEKKLMYLFDKTVIVKIFLDIQIKRLQKRDNISLEYAKKIIQTQASNEQRDSIKEYMPCYYIDNNGTKDKLREQVDNIAKDIGLVKK